MRRFTFWVVLYLSSCYFLACFPLTMVFNDFEGDATELVETYGEEWFSAIGPSRTWLLCTDFLMKFIIIGNRVLLPLCFSLLTFTCRRGRRREIVFTTPLYSQLMLVTTDLFHTQTNSPQSRTIHNILLEWNFLAELSNWVKRELSCRCAVSFHLCDECWLLSSSRPLSCGTPLVRNVFGVY